MTTAPTKVAVVALVALMLTGCAAQASEPNAAAPAPAESTPAATPTATPTPDPWDLVRSQGPGVYRVVDSDVLGELLDSPNRQSRIEMGADLTVDDGDVIALDTVEYGHTVSLQILDPDTHTFSMPEGFFVFWVDDLASLEEAGAVEYVPRS